MKRIALSGVVIALLLSASVSHAGYNVTLDSPLNGFDTGYISVVGFKNGQAQHVYIDQFNVTLRNDTTLVANYATFCVDLTHDVSMGQNYQVYIKDLNSPSAFPANTSLANRTTAADRMAYIYNAYGRDAISGSPNDLKYAVPKLSNTKYNANDYAAGIQLALWDLSLGQIDQNGKTLRFLPTTPNQTNTYTAGNLKVSHVTDPQNHHLTQRITDQANEFLLLSETDAGSNAGSPTEVKFLDASAQGIYLGRGQSLLEPPGAKQPGTGGPPQAPEPSSLGLLAMGSLCVVGYTSYKRRYGKRITPVNAAV